MFFKHSVELWHCSVKQKPKIFIPSFTFNEIFHEKICQSVFKRRRIKISFNIWDWKAMLNLSFPSRSWSGSWKMCWSCTHQQNIVSFQRLVNELRGFCEKAKRARLHELGTYNIRPLPAHTKCNFPNLLLKCWGVMRQVMWIFPE